jgi:hypothetical protein
MMWNENLQVFMDILKLQKEGRRGLCYVISLVQTLFSRCVLAILTILSIGLKNVMRLSSLITRWKTSRVH